MAYTSGEDPALELTAATTEYTAVRAAASAWFSSLATVVALGSVVGVSFGATQLSQLGTSAYATRIKIAVVVAVVLYGIGVLLAAFAAQGSRITSAYDAVSSLAGERHKAANRAATNLSFSRWLVVSAAVISTFLALLSLFHSPADPLRYRVALKTALHCGTLVYGQHDALIFEDAKSNNQTQLLKDAILTPATRCP
jgi:hypothetical protein